MKNGRGNIRNPQITKEDFLKKCEENHGQIYKTVEDLDIAYSRFRSWTLEDPAFKEAVENLQEATARFVERKLMDNIADGKEKSITFYLRTNKHARNIGYENFQKVEADLSGSQIDVEASLKKLAENAAEDPMDV